MKPLYFRLKGFKGLKVGLMDIDELIIDFEKGIATTKRLTGGTWEIISEIKFNPFSKGIIAFQGDNGTGKSTIFKNLHPFLMVVGADDKIQDHTYLRDSEKEFICEQDGIRYRSLILIDAQSGKAEAYLYKGENKEPLNNGLLTSYREAAEKVFGAEQIFATVLHSSRKLIPITQMKPADRKEIFYYYLGKTLSIFEEYDKIAKKRYDDAVSLMEKTRSRISFIQEQLSKMVTDEAIVSLGDKFIYQGTDRWQAIEKEMELIRQRGINLESKKSDCIKKVDELKKKVQIIDEQVMLENHKLSLVDETQEKIKQLEISKQVYEYDLVAVKEDYNLNSKATNNKKSELESEISRKEKILQNEGKINDAIHEMETLREFLSVTIPKTKTHKAEIEKEISQSNLDYQTLKNQYDAAISEITTRYDKQTAELEKEFTAKHSEYQLKLYKSRETKIGIENKYQKFVEAEEKKYSNEVTEFNNQQRTINTLELQEKAIEDQLASNETLFKQKKEFSIKEMERAQKEAGLIDKVPCVKYQDCVDTCEFLHNARMNRDMIGAIASQQIKIQNEFVALQEPLQASKVQRLTEIKSLKDRLIEPIRIFVDQTIKEIEKTRNNELSEVLDPEEPDDKVFISAKNVLRLRKDDELKVNEPEKPDTLVQDMELSRLKEIILKETQQRMKLELLERQGWENIKKEFDEVKLILPEKKSALSEILNQIKELDERFTKTKNEIEFNQSTIQLQIEQLSKQANKEEIQRTISIWHQQRVQVTTSIVLEDGSLRDYDSNILKLKSQLEAINDLSQDKTKEESELYTTERKVERLAFIREGLSKNGIPALIIHNVGIDVAQIANEFLKNTESGLRISFDTLKPTKNGYRESFEIPIYKNNQLIDIKNVNDGGTVYVDESINKAIGIYLTSSKYSNHRYQSEFSDEKDGALSENNKNLYLKLMQESLSLSDRDYLFLVTHSDSIWKQVNQRIHLYAGGKIQIVS
jgi:DNA repair exonuclease SbcCD ATPase subunit